MNADTSRKNGQCVLDDFAQRVTGMSSLHSVEVFALLNESASISVHRRFLDLLCERFANRQDATDAKTARCLRRV
jgi:hypothetical protein